MSTDVTVRPRPPAGQGRRLPWLRAGLLLALVIGLTASISLAEIALGLLAAEVLWRRRAEGGPALQWPLLGVIAGYAAWSVVAGLASARPFESTRSVKSVIWFGAMYVVLAALPDARAARRFATALFAAAAVVALFAIVQVTACPPAGTVVWPPLARLFRKCERAHGFFSIYMTLAGVLTMVLAMTLPRLTGFGRRAWWAVPGWLAGVAALGLTFVRGAWIAFAMAVGAGILTRRRHALVMGGAAVAAVLVALALPGVMPRARSIGDARDPTTRERLAMIDTGVRLLREHPLTGIGPGQVKHAYPLYAPPEAVRRSTSHLHNSPLQVAVERGLPGVALWAAIWGLFFWRAARIAAALPAGPDRALVLGCIIAIGAFLVAGLFEHNFGDTEVLLVAASLMALPFVIARAPAP
ncbi:MAG TPA: O-antigen ligase family protein [Candidatus Limnocylindria bacterium]|nr:O-antigen ligase family protein [Candidatus Limnocylindria bacterium]